MKLMRSRMSRPWLPESRRKLSREPLDMSSVTMQIGSVVTTAYRLIRWSCWSSFIIVASFKNSSLDIILDLIVLTATGVVPFHTAA